MHAALNRKSAHVLLVIALGQIGLGFVVGCGSSREYQACVKHRTCTEANLSLQSAQSACQDSEYLNIYGACVDCVLSHECEGYMCNDAGTICKGTMNCTCPKA